MKYSFFQCLVSIFDTGSLCSFKSKVLRVHLQLESPNSEHRNSRYVRNNPDFFMLKTDAGIGLPISSLLVDCWDTWSRNLEIPVTYVWFSLKSILIGHLNNSNRIRKEQVMARIRKLVETGNRVAVLPVEP